MLLCVTLLLTLTSIRNIGEETYPLHHTCEGEEVRGQGVVATRRVGTRGVGIKGVGTGC